MFKIHFFENASINYRANEKMKAALMLKYHELFGIPIGQVRGKLILQNGVVEERDFGKNLIVNKASILMARHMAPGDAAGVLTGINIADGFQYLALGTGVGTGTQMVPQPEELTQETLRIELIRKEFSDWRWLLADYTTASVPPTNIIELETTFDVGEANDALVEMGLFGGDATGVADSGHMFNYKVFPVWNKPVGSILIIYWTITF